MLDASNSNANNHCKEGLDCSNSSITMMDYLLKWSTVDQYLKL